MLHFVKLLPVILSAILMAAHFSRANNAMLVALSLAFPLILLVRRPWVARLTQAALAVAALEWIRTTIVIAVRRQGAGEPWARMAVILSSVAILTLASALVFRWGGLRGRYGFSESAGEGKTGEHEGT